MECIPKNPILEFNTDQLRLVRIRYNLDKPEMNRAIDVLEAWIQQQNHFMKKDFPRFFLENVIIASKGSLERAKQRLDKICTFRTLMPAFFGDNLTKCNVEDSEKILRCFISPKPTKENCRVCWVTISGSAFKPEVYLNCFRYLIMMCEYILARDYVDGLIFIADYNDVNIIELVKAVNLTDVRQFITIVTEGFGMRLKGIHLLTTSKAIEAVVTILKQFLSDKISKRMQVHKDTSTFFQYVPQDICPVEYGGKERSIQELHDMLKKELTGKAFLKYIEEMSKAKTDESCRPKNTFNEHYIGMPGSFRTLSVD